MENDCQGGSFLQRDCVGAHDSQMRHGGGLAMEPEERSERWGGDAFDRTFWLLNIREGITCCCSVKFLILLKPNFCVRVSFLNEIFLNLPLSIVILVFYVSKNKSILSTRLYIVSRRGLSSVIFFFFLNPLVRWTKIAIRLIYFELNHMNCYS